MASTTNSPSILDTILPVMGSTPSAIAKTDIIWDENQRMFITNQYTSAAGHTYYLGVRFCDQFITVIHVGMYYNWTYLDGIDIYAFDGYEKRLISQKKFGKEFYNEVLVRRTVEETLANHVSAQAKMLGKNIDIKEIGPEISRLVDKSYCSLLDNPETIKKLDAVRPILESELRAS